MRSQKKINVIKKIIIYLLLLIFVFYACFLSSDDKHLIQSPGEVFKVRRGLNRFFTTSYMAIFTNPVKRAYFLNSIIVSPVVMTFTLRLNLPPHSAGLSLKERG